MDVPSSDGLEIVEPSHHRPAATRPHKLPTPCARSTEAAQPGGARKVTQQLSNVIELGDSSDEDDGQPLPQPRARLDEDEDDDDVLIVGGSALDPVTRTNRPLLDPSSEDSLPSASALWGAYAPARAGGQPMGRTTSLLVGTSAAAKVKSAPLARAHTLGVLSDLTSPYAAASSSPRGFPVPLQAAGAGFPSSSPAYHAPPAGVGINGKGKARAADPGRSSLLLPEDVDDGDTDLDPFGRSTSRANPQWRPPAAEEDLWADILTSPGAKGKGKGKAREKEGVKDRKGKGKEREVDVDAVAGARKRRLSALAEDVNVDGPGRAGQTKAARTATNTTAAPSGASASTAGLSKTALKKLETADRVRLREANTLRAGDKKASTAELTVHVSGRAFLPPDDDEDGEVSGAGAGAGAGRKRPRKKASKPSPWLEITREVRERLKAYACDVEAPEEGDGAAPARGTDLDDVEGEVRWTRVCDRMWSDERRMFVPLRDGETIVVEEDSRLVFLSALDLSTHVAEGTLSAHLSSLQSRLAPHVNLFVLLFGLNTLFRDMERARQEAYRNQVRGEGGAGTAVRAAGIGERQPGKDELELALMRAQIEARCMIVSVDKVSEAVDWLEQLTFDVGQKPYQRLKHSHVALLGTSEDKVVSGKDLQDTYIKLLASLPKVTEPVAKGIVAEYPTLRDLYESWQACGDDKERREMLVGIGKGRNLDGTATHRTIGKDLSATIYRIMTGRDPNMFI